MYKSLVPLMCEPVRRAEIIESARIAFEKVIVGEAKNEKHSMIDYLESGGQVGVSFHTNKDLMHRVETLKLIQKSLIEYEKFENREDADNMSSDWRMLKLVVKQVEDVLGVWEVAEKVMYDSKKTNEKWSKEIDEKYKLK